MNTYCNKLFSGTRRRVHDVQRYSLSLISCAVMITPFAIADIYDPNEYLNTDTPEKRINETPDFLPETAEENYFEKVVTETYGFNLDVESQKNQFTLGEWKRLNGFENNLLPKLQGYYFNRADLGLARDMNCVRQWVEDIDLDTILAIDINDLNDEEGQVREFYDKRGKAPVACFVSNRGFIGGNNHDGFTGVLNDDEPFATVAMEFWPKLVADGDPNGVRFFVFGGPQENNDPDTGRIFYLENNFFVDGQQAYNAADVGNATAIKLDNGDGHSQPGICLSCHGGQLTANGDIVEDQNEGANFLPFYVKLMDFAPRAFVEDESNEANSFFKGFVDREEAIDTFNQMNSWIYFANKAARAPNDPPSKVEKTLLEVYGEGYLEQLALDDHSQIRVSPDADYVPEGFRSSPEEKALAENVYTPFCEVCHATSSESLSAGDFMDSSGTAFRYLCEESFSVDKNKGTETMPEAEVNERNLRRHADFVRHHIEGITGNTCDFMPTLVDFETDTAADEIIDVLAINVSSLDDNNIVTRSAVDDSNGNGVRDADEVSIKRTVQLAQDQTESILRVEERDFDLFGFNRSSTRLDVLRFSYFLSSAEDSIEVQFLRSEQGNIEIVNSDTVTINGPTEIDGQLQFIDRELSRNIPPNTFAANIILKRGSANNGSLLEIDDMLVQFDYLNRSSLASVIKQVDFEDSGSLNGAGVIEGAKLSNNEDSAVGDGANLIEQCRRQRAIENGDEQNGWELSNESRVKRDSGKNSFSTSRFVCAQDLSSFSMALDGNEDERVNVSFDFRSNPDAMLYLTVYERGRAIPQRLHLDAAEAPFFGRFLVKNIAADAKLAFTYAYKTRVQNLDVSRDYEDLEGASVDNVRVIAITP